MCDCAVQDDFKFAFAWDLWHIDGHVLLAGRNQNVSQQAYTALPFLSRIVNYQLLREDLIGGNKGGVEILVRSKETKVRKWVIYWTGYKQIRDESSSSALKSVSIQCDTIRTSTIPSLRDALARLARQMFSGNSDDQLQHRALFGKLRLEASVHDPYYCEAFASLRRDLSQDYEDMFSEDEFMRTKAIMRFLNDHCLQVAMYAYLQGVLPRAADYCSLTGCWWQVFTIRVEVVFQSLIRSLKELCAMVGYLGDAPTAEQRRVQPLPHKDKAFWVSMLKEFGQRNNKVDKKYANEFWGYEPNHLGTAASLSPACEPACLPACQYCCGSSPRRICKGV